MRIPHQDTCETEQDEVLYGIAYALSMKNVKAATKLAVANGVPGRQVIALAKAMRIQPRPLAA